MFTLVIATENGSMVVIAQHQHLYVTGEVLGSELMVEGLPQWS